MAKSSKKSKEAAAPNPESTSPGTETQSGPGPAKSVEPGVAKTAAAKPAKRAKTAGKNSAPARKTTTARKPLAATARKTGVAVSDEDIRLRAYFISEQRMQSGLAGDSAHDWLEARRQLQAEARQTA